MIAIWAGYLACGLVLLVGALAFSATVRWGGRGVARDADGFVRCGWVLLGLSLLVPLALFTGQVSPARRPPVEIWSGPALPAQGPAAERVSVRLRSGRAGAQAQSLSLSPGGLDLAGVLLALGALLAGGRLLRGERRLRRLCAGLPVVKRVGRVVLAAGSDEGGPFAARAGGLAYVVIPTSIFADPARLRLVLAHEAHHLRRGHVRSAQVQAVLRALFFWNPALPLWQRVTAEVEDLACDRRVLARWPALASEYGRCLLWAAGRGALGPAAGHARGMAAGPGGALARRVRLLAEAVPAANGSSSPSAARGAGARLLAGLTMIVVVAAGLVVHACVATPRTTAAEVEQMGQRIEARSGFPVIADGRIAEALNRRLTDPAWRDGVKAGLARMPRYRPIIEEHLQQAGLPLELGAMVMTESRFDPEARTSRPVERRAVGLWQFIPGTARRLGLVVTPEQDERLDPVRASAAAARYLGELYQHYGDWHLAIAAYNGGRRALDTFRNGASVADTRDRLLASDLEFGRYLTSVMISLLVIENPELLD